MLQTLGHPNGLPTVALEHWLDLHWGCAALLAWCAVTLTPRMDDPLPAVQVQYPDALPTMALDLSNIRLAAAFLSKVRHLH